ncbi:hypothetical protein LZ32DRAFT_109796 [Colletotrichum eremochloae]|nr:hypothetical protein LZ32DRAFT_109796 [Colletotrichum eremochloae]
MYKRTVIRVPRCTVPIGGDRMQAVGHVTNSSNDTCVEEPMGSLLDDARPRAPRPAHGSGGQRTQRAFPATNDPGCFAGPCLSTRPPAEAVSPADGCGLVMPGKVGKALDRTQQSPPARLCGESPPAAGIYVSNRPHALLRTPAGSCNGMATGVALVPSARLSVVTVRHPFTLTSRQDGGLECPSKGSFGRSEVIGNQYAKCMLWSIQSKAPSVSKRTA